MQVVDGIAAVKTQGSKWQKQIDIVDRVSTVE